MNSLLVELDRLVNQGVEFVSGASLPSAAVREWLGQRGRLFAEIDRASALMDDVERLTLNSLIDEILGLDATIVAKAEAEMRQVGDEIAGAQKLRAFLAGSAKVAQPSFLRRAL